MPIHDQFPHDQLPHNPSPHDPSSPNPSAPDAPSLNPSVPPSSLPAPPGPRAPERPQPLPVDFAAVPLPLRACSRWLLWRYRQAPDGTWQKLFFTARGNRAAQPSPDLGAPFEAVQATYEFYLRRAPYDGIAFALGDGFAVIELQDVFSGPTQHDPHPWVRKLVADLPTYTERTPDGCGLTLISFGPAVSRLSGHSVGPLPHPQGGTIAVCRQGQVVCLTGRRWPLHSQVPVEDLDRQFRQLADRLHRETDLTTILPDPPAPVATPGPVRNTVRLESEKYLEDPRLWFESDHWAEHRALPPEPLPPSTPAQPPSTQSIAPADTSDPRPKEPEYSIPEADWVAVTSKASRLERALKERNEECAKLRERERERSRPPADRLVDLAHDEFRIGRTALGEAFVVSRSGPNIARLFHRNSESLRDALTRRARTEFGEPLPTSAVIAAVRQLHHEATEAEPEEVHLRLAPFRVSGSNKPSRFSGSKQPSGSSGSNQLGRPDEPVTADPVLPPLPSVASPPTAARLNRRARRLAKQKRKDRRPLPLVERTADNRRTATSDDAESLVSPLISSSPHLLTEFATDPQPRTQAGDGILLDLGRPDGKAVEITPDGWRIIDRCPVLFRRTPLTGELPIPECGGSLDQLRSLINVAEASWPLLRGWLVASMFPSIAHPILLLGGTHGSGKSTALRILSSLVDPSPAPLRSEPRDADHWTVMAHNSWCIPLDNISSIPDWFGDAMCKAVTGDGLVRRKLNTDRDLSIFEFRRVVALSSIDPGAVHGDLADRLLLIDLDPIDEHRRRPESQLLAEFERLKPKLLGALLLEVSQVLKRLPHVKPRRLPRMADFGRIIAALAGEDAAAAIADLPSPLGVSAPVGNAVPGVPSSGVARATAGPPPTEEHEPKAQESSRPIESAPLMAPPFIPLSHHPIIAASAAVPLDRSDKSDKSDESDESDESDDFSRPKKITAATDKQRRSPTDEGAERPKAVVLGQLGASHPPSLSPSVPPSSADRDSPILALYFAQRRRLAADVIESDPFGQALLEFVFARGIWEGTAAELLTEVDLKSLGPGRPKTSSAVGCRLKRLTPTLSLTGVKVYQWRDSNAIRTRRIRLETAQLIPSSSN